MVFTGRFLRPRFFTCSKQTHVPSKHTSFFGHQTALLPSIHDFNQKFLPTRAGFPRNTNVTSPIKLYAYKKKHARNTHDVISKNTIHFRISIPNFPYMFNIIIWYYRCFFSMERNIFRRPVGIVLEIEVFCFGIGRISQVRAVEGSIFGGSSQLVWLVVSTHLKNISQIGSCPQVGVNIKNIWNHHLVVRKWFGSPPTYKPWKGHLEGGTTLRMGT